MVRNLGLALDDLLTINSNGKVLLETGFSKLFLTFLLITTTTYFESTQCRFHLYYVSRQLYCQHFK